MMNCWQRKCWSVRNFKSAGFALLVFLPQSGISICRRCICSLSLLLISCSATNDDLVHYISAVKHRKTQELEPIPSFNVLPRFIFSKNDARRSPFTPITDKKNVGLNAPNKHKHKQFLEAYPLSSLRFVGTLEQDHDLWALIEVPEKDIKPVRVGDYMGPNNGRIVSIKNDSIQLIEITMHSGSWEKHKVEIELFIGK
jgi:type IV pilus assembly protein PilP